MNSSWGIWLMAAGAVALAFLLLLAPVEDQQTGSDLAVLDAAPAGETSSYWHPVSVQEPATPSVVSTPAWHTVTTTTRPPTSGSCSTCGAVGGATAPAPALVGGCGYPSAPCAKVPCTCRPSRRETATPPITVPAYSEVPLVGGCGSPSMACRPTTCVPLSRRCTDLCADPCRMVKPGINRNMPPCVNECSFVQFHSTVSHPICDQVCFEWSASKGWFLDPGASDPLFFAPSTQFASGEDVWITLVVTDASGVQYSDVVSIHVCDLP